MPSTKPEELSTRGLYTKAADDKKGTSENTGEKVDFCKFAVEKRRARPYRTRSYQPCGAFVSNRYGEEAGCPPVLLSGSCKSNRRETLFS